MDEASTARLRGLLESASEPGSTPVSLIESHRLRRALESTRLWVLTLCVVSLISLALFIAGSILEIRRAAELNDPGNAWYGIWIGFLIFYVALFVPLFFLVNYLFRLHGFLRNGGPERFLRMIVSQRWMWTILGIYAVFFIFLTGLMLLFSLGSLIAYGMANPPGGDHWYV